MPVQHWQHQRCNADNDARACCKHSAGKDANAASVGPLKAKLPWNNAGYGDKATDEENDHNNNATYADVSRLRRGWVDASLQFWRQCGGNEGGNASAMRAKTPARGRQQRQCNTGNNDSKNLATMTVQCLQ
jgi:hypothetical protein